MLAAPFTYPEIDSVWTMLVDLRRFLAKSPERLPDVLDIIGSRNSTGWKDDGAGPVTYLTLALAKFSWDIVIVDDDLAIERSRVPMVPHLKPMSFLNTSLEIIKDMFIDAFRKAMWR